MSRRLTSILAAAALAVGASLAAPASAAPSGPTSLAEVLDADGNKFDRNWNDFDIVDRLVRRTIRLKPGTAVAVLADANQDLTAFIPTDRAFRKLVFDLAGVRGAKEKDVVMAIVSTFDIDTIEAVLLYHVILGATIDRATAEGADGVVLTTAQGGTIEVNIKGHRIKLKDLDPNDANPKVIRRLSDINIGNPQIAHGINRVLRLADL